MMIRKNCPRIVGILSIYSLLYLAAPFVQKANVYLLSRLISFYTVAKVVDPTIVFIPYKTSYLAANITAECSGILGVAIIATMILIPDTELKKKALGILLSVPLIFGGNLLRMLIIILIGPIASVSFISPTHVLSQLFLFLWILFTWTFYLFYVVKAPRWERARS